MINTILWVAQGWLAAVFLGVGVIKLVTPKAELETRKGMGYAADRTEAELKLIGFVEVLGAAGLILPWILGILPVLTPLAAAGLAATMAGAIATHRRRKEPATVPAVLLALAVIVAAGRIGMIS